MMKNITFFKEWHNIAGYMYSEIETGSSLAVMVMTMTHKDVDHCTV